MFVKIYFFFLLVNISLTIVDGYASDIGQVDVAGNITSVASGTGVGQQPKFFNNTTPSGTVILNFSDTRNSSLVGHSGSGNTLFDPITQAGERLFYVGEIVFEVLTGNFIINVMNAFTASMGVNAPDEWTFGLQVLVGFINIFFIVYIITSRSMSAFT